MSKTNPSDKLVHKANVVVAAIFVLLPFHAFLTTWLGSVFGAPDLFKIWKEILITGLAFGAAVLVVRTPELKQRIRRDLVFKLIGLYILLHLLRAAAALASHDVSAEALLFALIINLRFLVFFMVTFVVASRSSWLHSCWAKLVMIPAAVVLLFGILQQFFLPKDFLSHFGYGPDTIPAQTTVDNKASYTRLMSTLRGANPFGAYLVFISSAYLALVRKRPIKYPGFSGGGLVLPLVLLIFTYSRSAWLGLLVSLAALLWLGLQTHKSRQYFFLSGVALVLLFGSLIFIFKDNDRLQNSLFHTDETSTSAVSSNAARWQAFTGGVSDAVREPLGRGPGTAGPASARSNQARIAENYFVQIGQEVGLAGVVLFGAITVMVGVRLYRRRGDTLALVLFCTLLGISLINMLLHAWTDDTLALLWWGLAGVALAVPPAAILNRKHEQKTNKPLT